MKKIILLLVILCLPLSVLAFNSPHLENSTMNIYPGQTIDYEIRFVNTMDTDAYYWITFVDGKEFADLSLMKDRYRIGPYKDQYAMIKFFVTKGMLYA